MELEATRKDGSTVWIELRATFLRDQAGRPIGILGVNRDISERQQAEEMHRHAYDTFNDQYFTCDGFWYSQFDYQETIVLWLDRATLPLVTAWFSLGQIGYTAETGGIRVVCRKVYPSISMLASSWGQAFVATVNPLQPAGPDRTALPIRPYDSLLR